MKGQLLDYVSAFHLLRQHRNASHAEYSLLIKIREFFTAVNERGTPGRDVLVFPIGRRGRVWTHSSRAPVEVLNVGLWTATVRCSRAHRRGTSVGLSAEDERGDVHAFAARVLQYDREKKELTLRILRTL